jgi:carboxyl-terminal processing protease
LIVGDSATHGKGTVQSLVQLRPLVQRMDGVTTNDPGAIKITVRKFYRANGESTQLKGVTPDIVLPSVNNYAEVGESALDDPLPWDTIKAAKYSPENRIKPVIEEIQARSDNRIAEDQDYQYVLEDIALYQKRLADKSVSLNEAERRQEKKRNEERIEARKQERKSRPALEETVYEISLKHVTQPGLPTPLNSEDDSQDDLADDPSLAADEASDEDDDSPPPVDVNLREAQRILLDLISLSNPTELAAQNR